MWLLLDLFWCHESGGGLRFIKRAIVENCISEVIPITPFCVQFQFLDVISITLFWKPNIPLDSFWWVESNFELKSLFWLKGENFHILDDFAPSVDNSDLELKSDYERKDNTIRLMWEIETQILNLFWVLLLF